MSGQYVRLPDSKRNELISKFNKGVVDPDYEVIPSKNTEGRYTIRKRKVPLPVPDNQPAQDQPQEEQSQEQPQEQPQEEIDPYLDDRAYYPPYKLNKNAMFRELQLQMNRMMIENMKLMRQQVKATEKKRQKLKEKSKKMSQFLSKVLDEAEKEEPEPVSEEPHEEEEHNEEEQQVEESNVPLQEPEQKSAAKYVNQYEEKLSQLAGDTEQGYSRRDRLHFERFNI